MTPEQFESIIKYIKEISGNTDDNSYLSSIDTYTNDSRDYLKSIDKKLDDVIDLLKDIYSDMPKE